MNTNFYLRQIAMDYKGNRQAKIFYNQEKKEYQINVYLNGEELAHRRGFENSIHGAYVYMDTYLNH